MPSNASQSVSEGVESVLGPAPASHAQPEVIVLRVRRHGIRLTVPVVLLIAIATLAGFWVGRLPDGWMNLAAGAGAGLAALLFGVLPILGWLTHRTTITSRRVISHRGLFSRYRSEVSLNRVRDVRLRRGVAQRLRGSGDIEMLHGNETLVLRDVPGAGRVSEALHDLMERNYENATRMQQRLTGLAAGAAQSVPGMPSAPGSPGPSDEGDSRAEPGSPVSFW